MGVHCLISAESLHTYVIHVQGKMRDLNMFALLCLSGKSDSLYDAVLSTLDFNREIASEYQMVAIMSAFEKPIEFKITCLVSANKEKLMMSVTRTIGSSDFLGPLLIIINFIVNFMSMQLGWMVSCLGSWVSNLGSFPNTQRQPSYGIASNTSTPAIL